MILLELMSLLNLIEYLSSFMQAYDVIDSTLQLYKEITVVHDQHKILIFRLSIVITEL